jgi:hypothetical protein
MAVVALSYEVHVEAKAVHMRLLRARQCEAAAGRVCRVVDVERFPAPVSRGDAFDLESEDVGYRD